MIVYDQDPRVVPWGLHNLIHVSYLSNASCQSITHYNRETSEVGYVTEGYNNQTNHMENDAVIAHAFQEELSRQWLGPSGGECHDSDVLIADESALDGEVGKRLNQMVPVPHVLKTNRQMPSEDGEFFKQIHNSKVFVTFSFIDEIGNICWFKPDFQTMMCCLFFGLKVYDLVENKVEGDGNCQFRALSDQLYRSPEMYEGYVPMSFSEYLKKMDKSGEWGDHVTLQAAADSDTCYIEILPHSQKSKRVIFLSFWAEVHYNSIYLPLMDTRKKKKWWMFGT
ncbi:hypothetical protein K2173_004112 [Erythroxylum novogranatense]|uniref:OTU domain-containing protein n=1 Tax=Erythroxylum novogranatense TaxID=1862640 RepID=A0AAV8SY83_9ROSI|nr:hypothetical protein K2173_004112 [Erythroxylum novogranatense]